MPNAILVVMVLAVGDVLCITHCHLLTTVPGDGRWHQSFLHSEPHPLPNRPFGRAYLVNLMVFLKSFVMGAL